MAANLDIPDNTEEGILSELTIESELDALVSENFRLSVDLIHTYSGDLQLYLKAPDDTIVVLWERQGGNTDNIQGVFPTTLEPVDSFDLLKGKPLVGNWTLEVKDRASQDTGTLVSWGIEDITSFECN